MAEHTLGGAEPRWCTTCVVPHIENCPKCFGFGLYAHEPHAPVSAVEAHGDEPARGAVMPCTICGGGPANVEGARPVAFLPTATSVMVAAEDLNAQLHSEIARVSAMLDAQLLDARRTLELRGVLDQARAVQSHRPTVERLRALLKLRAIK